MQNQDSKDKTTSQSDEEIMAEKLIEAINKYSCQSKTYPPMEWWEFMG